MKRIFTFFGSALCFIALLDSQDVKGQCLYHPALAGSDTAVTFTLTGGIFASYGCAPIDPTYWVSGFGATMTSTFTTPQTNPSFRIWGMNDDDSASVTVNGVAYPLTASSASYDAKVVCGISPGPNGVIFANGKLVGANSNGQGNYSYQNVTIKAAGVTSIQVRAISGAGWGYVGVSTSCAAPPVATFTSSDTAFCDEAGKCISFTDHSIGNPISWQWSFPGALPNTSSQQNPVNICYSTPGTYAVTLIVSNAAGTDTLVASPLIFFGNPPPPPTLIQHVDTLFSSHAYSYQWFMNGSPIPGATDSFIVACNYGGGNFAVLITDSLGCSSLSNQFSAVCVNVNEVNKEYEIHVYPNPVRDQFTVYGLRFTVRDIEIFNVLGERVLNMHQINGNRKSETVLDISGLAKGIYFLQLKSDRETVVKRIVKE